MNWMASISLSSSGQSCHKLSNVESCVNRVVSHLDALNKQCVHLYGSIEPGITLTLPKLARVASSKTKLMVEGVTTGMFVETKKV